MEYIDGETMLSWMQRTLRGRHTKCDQCGEISEVPVIPILLRDSIVLACRLYVAAMRQGIFQNDLKVSNVMFDIRGQVFLIDYGQAEKIREQSDFIRIHSGFTRNFSAMRQVFLVSLKEESEELRSHYMDLMEYWPTFDELMNKEWST